MLAIMVGILISGCSPKMEHPQPVSASSDTELPKRLPMPGEGEFYCNHPGLYKIYYETDDERYMPPSQNISAVDKGRSFDDQAKLPGSIQRSLICKIQPKGIGALIPLAAPLVEEGQHLSKAGRLIKVAVGTFMAPRAGAFKIKSHSMLSDSPDNYTLVVMPQGWCDWQPKKLNVSAHLIPKGKVISQADLEADGRVGNAPQVPQPPHNIVGDELDLVGCTASNAIPAGSFIRYCDIELPSGKESPR
jgi:hypothetical protein